MSIIIHQKYIILPSIGSYRKSYDDYEVKVILNTIPSKLFIPFHSIMVHFEVNYELV